MGQLYPFTQADYWTGTQPQQDAATQQVEALLYALAGNPPPEEGVIVSEKDFAFDDASPKLVREVQPDETADEILLTIVTAFDAGSLSVGDASDPARLMLIDDLTGYSAGDQIQLSPQYRYPAVTDANIYLTGTPTAGLARITLYSYLPEA